jgi:hypothetical protein
MATIKQEIDLSVLSAEARKELVDFYQFLVSKYGRSRSKKAKRFQNLIEHPLRVKKIIIPAREQLHER